MNFNNSSIYLGSNIPAYLMDCSITVPLSSDGISLELHFMENNFHTLLKQSFPDDSDIPLLIKERHELNKEYMNITNPMNINRFDETKPENRSDILFFLEMLYQFNELDSFTIDTIFTDDRNLDAIKKFKDDEYLNNLVQTMHLVISHYKKVIDSYEPKTNKKYAENLKFLPNTIMMYIRHTNVILIQNDDLKDLKQNIYTDVSKYVPKIIKNRDMLQTKINHYNFFFSTDFQKWFDSMDFDNPDDLVHVFQTLYRFIDLFNLYC